MRPVKNTPAQNISAYTALKLGGNNPGQRLNATNATKTNGSQRFHFSVTAVKNNPARENDKSFAKWRVGHLQFWRGERPREPDSARQSEALFPVGRASSRAGQRGNSNFQTSGPLNNFGNVNLHQDNQFPQRQNPSPGVHAQLGQSNIVLLTINTEKRKPWLANERTHQLLRQTWLEATAWLVGDYLLMPDHLHLFCAPRDLHFTVETWISYWKREFALKQKRLARTACAQRMGNSFSSADG
jgi:hypothetical protein